MTKTAWFVEGRDEGPVALEVLAGLARSGGIAADTRVRDTAEGEWAVAGERLPGLFVRPPKARTVGWTDVSPHPWRRYAARIADNTIVGLATWWIIGLVAYSVAPAESDAFFAIFTAPGGQLLDAMLTLLCAIPGNAAMIGLSGLSIGKWIFGVRVLRNGRPIGFRAALVRELDIWARGLALGVPLISLGTLIVAFNRLQQEKAAVWDQRQGNTVVHREESAPATVGMIAAVVALVIVLVAMRVLNETP